jgi:hypothetical protein
MKASGTENSGKVGPYDMIGIVGAVIFTKSPDGISIEITEHSTWFKWLITAA